MTETIGTQLTARKWESSALMEEKNHKANTNSLLRSILTGRAKFVLFCCWIKNCETNMFLEGDRFTTNHGSRVTTPTAAFAATSQTVGTLGNTGVLLLFFLLGKTFCPLYTHTEQYNGEVVVSKKRL